MRLFVLLTEELESRPEDADRVDSLARYLRAAGRDVGALAGGWLVADSASTAPARPRRLTQAALTQAASVLAGREGTPGWLFDAGRAASSEAAEAIALLLPWPAEAAVPITRPSLADWLVRWSGAAQEPDATHRALAIAQTIAQLDDPMTRRWAVRAVCGLVKPLVSAWQWQRAWASAFDEDEHEVAWRWHRQGGAKLIDSLQASERPAGRNAERIPRPLRFAPLPDAPAELHADLLAAWRRAEFEVEPRWNGVRVQIVRHDGEVAIWPRRGGLFNPHLPLPLTDPDGWPPHSVIEAVLVAWPAGELGSEILAAAQESSRSRQRSEAENGGRSLHLVVVDWHRWAGEDGDASTFLQRRARLRLRWPVHEDLDVPPPPIFATPALRASDVSLDLASLAVASQSRGWSGLVVRHHVRSLAAEAASVVHAPLHRVLAVLQYVPTEALAASAASARALAFVDCGFALWNRAPVSAEEQHAAMTAAMAGEFIAPPTPPASVATSASIPPAVGLRLLPFSRAPITLPDHDLQRLHTWLRANAGQRFGDMLAVAPALVFELGFARLRDSPRHKIGMAPLGVRVLRWLPDAPPGGAQRVDELPGRDLPNA